MVRLCVWCMCIRWLKHSSLAVDQCMVLGMCIRWLNHSSMAVDTLLKSMRLVSVYKLAVAQWHGSRCMT